MKGRDLGRRTAIVSAAAAASRVLGFVRDVLLAALLGSGPVADAFVVAFRIPSLIRRVLGEGALNAGFVPVAQRIEAEEGPAAAGRFAGEALSTVAWALLLLTALAEVVAPWLVLGLAGGFADDPARLDTATLYTRLMLPLVAATVLSALAAAVLNAAGRVVAAAVAPVAVNVVLVATLLVLGHLDWPPERLGTALAAAVSVAGIVQCLVLVPALAALPAPPRPGRPRLSPEVRRMLAIGLPGLAVAAAGQLGILVATQVASHEPAAVARLYYAERLFALPLGFVAAGAGVVLLPEIARQLKSGLAVEMLAAQNRAVEWALLLALPAAAALVALAQPIVSVLFERGAFTAQDTAVTAACLAALACGLPAAAVTRVVSQAFFARESVRIPVLVAVLSVVATLAVALALEPRLGAAGVAWAVTAGAWLNAAGLLVPAARLGWYEVDERLASRLPRMALATAVMALVVGALALALAPWLHVSAPIPARAAVLGGLCLSGLVVYAVLALATGAVRRADLGR
ncbi:murein biosynthesis integral membrane protein MurJ [Alsobacter sp. R-9]